MADNDRSADRSIAQRAARKLLLPPDQRRKELRKERERRIWEQPEKTRKAGFQRGALLFFLRCFRRQEPRFLSELREILSVPLLPRTESLLSLLDRYDVPKAAINECLKTHLMWQALPDLPDVWHFELPEGALTDPLRSANVDGAPYPFVFVAEGWNPNIETLAAAKKRLLRQFKATLNTKTDKATFWKSAEIDHLELRLFEESPSLEKLRRNLECLAEKQVNSETSQRDLADRFGLTRHALRLGLFEAADLIGLPRGGIRTARAGAPPGVPHRRSEKG